MLKVSRKDKVKYLGDFRSLFPSSFLAVVAGNHSPKWTDTGGQSRVGAWELVSFDRHLSIIHARKLDRQLMPHPAASQKLIRSLGRRVVQSSQGRDLEAPPTPTGHLLPTSAPDCGQGEQRPLLSTELGALFL